MMAFFNAVGPSTAWAMLTTLVMVASVVINLWLSSKFARKSDLEAVEKDVADLKTRVASQPSTDEMHDLALNVESLRGDMKGLSAQTTKVEHLVELLVEQQLKSH